MKTSEFHLSVIGKTIDEKEDKEIRRLEKARERYEKRQDRKDEKAQKEYEKVLDRALDLNKEIL